MDRMFLPLTVVFVMVIALAALLNTFLFAKAKKTVVFWLFMMVQSGLFLWLFGAYMAILAPTAHVMAIYVTLQHGGIILISWGWALLGWMRADGNPTNRSLAVLSFISFIMMICVLTNPIHNRYLQKISLDVQEPGMLFRMCIFFILLNFVCGGVGFWRKSKALTKKGLLAVALTGTGVILCAMLSLQGGFMPPARFAPAAAFLMLGIITLLDWQDLFRDISPVSLHAFMNSISDAVIIIDGDQNIVDANNLGKLADFAQNKSDQSIVKFVEQMNKHVMHQTNRILNDLCGIYLCQVKGDIVLSNGEETCGFSVSATPLYDQTKKRIGGIIIFHDITEEMSLHKALDEKNAELEKTNVQLKDYVMIANRLEEEREKSRIAAEIQNSLGQKIMEILAVLEVLRYSADQDRMRVKENLQKAIDACRGVLADVRTSVARIMSSIGQSTSRGKSEPEQRRERNL